MSLTFGHGRHLRTGHVAGALSRNANESETPGALTIGNSAEERGFIRDTLDEGKLFTQLQTQRTDLPNPCSAARRACGDA